MKKIIIAGAVIASVALSINPMQFGINPFQIV